MALYEYLCRDCDTTFELRRPMGEADRDVMCPSGHVDVRRKLSVVAAVGASAGPGAMPSIPAMAGGGGCCGGGCGCG
jgi:putative FmdB family regulatory protein